MALIEVYNVVPDYYDVDPDFTGTIIEGQLVSLGADGYVKAADIGELVIGIAGDSISSTGQTEYSADVVISPSGAVRSTENRVANEGDETLASGKLTVYNSGGKFKTDQYDTTKTYVIGTKLYADDDGIITNASDGGRLEIGYLVGGPAAEESGVPGTDINGSTTLGTFITVLLKVA